MATNSNPLDALASTPAAPAGPVTSGNPLDKLNTRAEITSQPAASGNPLDQLNTPVSNSPAAAPQASSNPLDSLNSLLIKPAVPAATDLLTYAANNNPLDQLLIKPLTPAFTSLSRPLSNAEVEYAKGDPTKMEDEPWYSKAREWMNSPLYDLHKWGTRTGAGTFERGLETGLEDIGSGFLTPLQLGLAIGTFGGSLAESAGVDVAGAGLSALSRIGVSKVAAPVVVNGLKTMASAGFSLDMLHGLVTQSPQFLDALKDGDVETATRLGTNLLATGAFLRQSMSHGFEDLAATKRLYNKSRGIEVPTENIKLAAEIAGNYDTKISMSNDATRAKIEELQAQLASAGVNDPTTEAGIRHYLNTDGDVSRIQKMIGIAEGTIKPREYTAEETDQIKKSVELNKWAGQSKDSVKNPDGSPRVLYLTDSADGTHKLGQTLATSGDEADAHFIRMKNPLEMRSEENLKRYIEEAGGEAEAKSKIQAAGYDGITYGANNGKKFLVFDNKQYQPVEQIAADPAQPWNREHVYIALDNKYQNQILNAGIKNAARKEVQYFATPGEALKNATLPDSGNPKDLNVYAVPRAEVEQGARDYHYGEQITDDNLTTNKSHMPGHLLELDDKGNFTGRSTPLRPLSAEDLPGDNSRFNNSYTPDEKNQYIAGMKAALNLTEDQKAVAKTFRELYDNSFERMHRSGLIRNWIEAYHPQAWASEPNGMWNYLFGKDTEPVVNSTLNTLRSDTNSGHFDTNVNQAKHRAYSTEFEGIMAGQKFKTDDLLVHAANHLKAIDRALAAREYLEDLRQKSARAQDGRPAAVLAGTTRVMGQDTGNPALAIDPKAVRNINISDALVQDMQITNPKTNMTPLEEGLRNGTIEKLPWTIDREVDGKTIKVPAYAYSSEGYESIDHPAMRGWGFSGVDTAGKPAILRGDIKVHPDFANHVRQVLGAEKSVFRTDPRLRLLQKASGEAKGLLLSISPFHIMQEGLRAAMMGINPFDASHLDINYNPKLRLAVKNGLIRHEFQAEDKYSNGFASHSKIVSAIPGLNRLQAFQQDFLFNKYIPSLKDRAFLRMYDDMRDSYPHLTADEAASRTADTINDVFGGQNWRKLGVSAAQQDFYKMVALAPDWLLSEIRMLGRSAGMMDKESGAYVRKQMAKQTAAIWLAARVLNGLASGGKNFHNEAPFGVVRKNDKGEETVYSVRTLPTDLLHVMSDPEGFLRNRVNPLTIRPLVEGLTGRDQMGRRADIGTQISDEFRNVVPIAAQGLFRTSDLDPVNQAFKGVGGNVYKYRTEAEKLAQQYASDRMPSGPVNPENLKAHQEDIRLEDAFRRGEISKGQISQRVSKRRADEIIRRAPMTPLQARFDRLPLSEAINVWDAATKAEKDQLASMLWKKRAGYLKQHSAAERAEDPTWRKLQSVYADLH